MMPMFWRQHDITALVTDKIFVVRRNQEELALPEASCATVVLQVEVSAFPTFYMDSVA